MLHRARKNTKFWPNSVVRHGHERFPPRRPERSQRNPERPVQGSQSSARPLRLQSEQLPTESQVFEEEVLAGAKRADDPPGEMPERHNHLPKLFRSVTFS
jgi:hypothetical protein